MNQKSFTLLGLFLAIMLQLPACKGDAGPAGPIGPQGSFERLIGALYGRVTLYDVDSINITDNSNIAVSIEGSNLASLTDRNGWWRMNGLTTGNYTLVFSKAGYGTYKDFSYQFIGGDSVYYGMRSLESVCKFYVQTLSDSLGSDYFVHFFGTLSSTRRTTWGRDLIVFMDTSPLVSSTHYTAYYISNIDTSVSFNVQVARFDLVYYYGFALGSTIYSVAYGIDGGYLGSYFDPTLRLTIFPSISQTPSPTAQIQLL